MEALAQVTIAEKKIGEMKQKYKCREKKIENREKKNTTGIYVEPAYGENP